MTKQVLEERLAEVTQTDLDIEKLSLKKELERVKTKRWDKIDDVVMNVIKYAIWPLATIFAVLVLRR